jgi:hypothetical protein
LVGLVKCKGRKDARTTNIINYITKIIIKEIINIIKEIK